MEEEERRVAGRRGLIIVGTVTRRLRTCPRFCVTSVTTLSTRRATTLHHGYFRGSIGLMIIGGALLNGTLRGIRGTSTSLMGMLRNPASVVFTGITGTPTILVGRFHGGSSGPILGTTFTRKYICINSSRLSTLYGVGSGRRLVNSVVTLLRSPTGGIVSTLRTGTNRGVTNVIGALRSEGGWSRSEVGRGLVDLRL